MKKAENKPEDFIIPENSIDEKAETSEVEMNDEVLENISIADMMAQIDEKIAELDRMEKENEQEEETEDLSIGEMNPYTGREYESNSVRMHPKRIGYVQVYSRKDHKWQDMTEWAFLGEQERKKVELGDDYVSPIYLD